MAQARSARAINRRGKNEGCIFALLFSSALSHLVSVLSDFTAFCFSACEAELDSGSCPSGDVNQDLPAQGASVAEPESDPGSSSVSTGISLGNDSTELVVEEFSSSS